MNVDPSSQSKTLALHGVLLDIFGIGVLICGESGIGKSETALELIRRGHGLAADDAVVVSAVDGRLSGSAPEMSFGYMEVRGLGIVNVRELFGEALLRKTVKIDLCIDLLSREAFGEVDRLGPRVSKRTILDLEIPVFTLPAGPERNLPNLLEIAVRTFALETAGSRSDNRLIDIRTVAAAEEI